MHNYYDYFNNGHNSTLTPIVVKQVSELLSIIL